MGYTLASPIPEIFDLTSIDGEYITEGVAVTGFRCMWKNTNTNEYHLMASFGGFNDGYWYANYVNMSDPTKHGLINGLRGSANHWAYNPQYDKVYIGTGYAGSFAEFVPSTKVLNEISSSLDTVIGVRIADDWKVYVMTASNVNHIYSYDPSVGLSSWKDYGAIPQSVGQVYGTFGADADYVYVTVRRTDDTYTLLICATSDTVPIDWTAWTYDGDSDLSVTIQKDIVSPHKWVANRTLANGTTQYYYDLEGGAAVNQRSGNATTNNDNSSPQYCVKGSEEGEYDQFNQYYSYDVDFSDLFPVKTVHEFTIARYKLHSATEYDSNQETFTGPWVANVIRFVMPKSGADTFCLSRDYMAAFAMNYLTPTHAYIGAEQLSPYVIKQHPVSRELYAGGYPNRVWRYNQNLDYTLDNTNVAPVSGGGNPGEGGRPNPYCIDMDATNLHYRHAIDFDNSGLVWIGGNTTRLSTNYGDVMCYKPSDGTTGYMFPSWVSPGILFRSLCSCLGRTKILVANSNDQIVKINAADQTVDATITVRSSQSKSYMIETSNDNVVVVTKQDSNSTWYIGVLKPSDMTWTITQVTFISKGLNDQPFGNFVDSQYERMYWKLELGPDGFVWMFVGNSLYRIDPTDLTFTKVKDTTYGALIFTNNMTDLVLYNINGGSTGGNTDIKYIPGIFSYTNDYSRGSYVSLPTDDANLDTPYAGNDLTDVAADDTDMVAQLATSQKAIHQFKQQITGTGGIITAVAQVTIPCSTSTTYLQIYNRSGTPAWDTIDSDNATGANTDFTLSASIADLTDYKDENNIVACRVYQEMQ